MGKKLRVDTVLSLLNKSETMHYLNIKNIHLKYLYFVNMHTDKCDINIISTANILLRKLCRY